MHNPNLTNNQNQGQTTGFKFRLQEIRRNGFSKTTNVVLK